jgi:hypothetical protein
MMRRDGMTTVQELANQHYTLRTLDGEHSFEGALLGFGTSRRRSHINHHPGSTPPPGTRCSGCRWTDTKIYWSATDSKYIVHIVGVSIVPGERDKIRVVWAEDADAVLDGLLIAPPRHLTRQHRSTVDPTALELPQPNAHALEEASEHDAALADVHRAWSAGEAGTA